MKRALLLVVLLLRAVPAVAQPLPMDRLTPAWAPEHRHAAEIASNITPWAAVALDTWASFHADDPKRALLTQGLADGAVMGLGLVVKMLVHRERPCAPVCGVDNPNYSFWSGHTALACTATSHRLAFTIPLATLTAAFRIGAGKHYLSDTLAGCAAGAISGVLRK